MSHRNGREDGPEVGPRQGWARRLGSGKRTSPPGMFKGPVSSLLPSTHWVPAQALGPGRTQNSFVGAERGEGPAGPTGPL